MRRASAIVFFLGAIACAILLYARLARRPPSPTPAPVSLAEPARPVASSPAPRLALAVPPRDAGQEVRAGQDLRATPLDEKGLLGQIRALVRSDPARAEALAREARRRFPDGAEADERDALLVDALINQQRIGAARDETYYYFDHHPQGRFAEHLFVMTGVHPRPGRP
jgi:hypothetical protein